VSFSPRRQKFQAFSQREEKNLSGAKSRALELKTAVQCNQMRRTPLLVIVFIALAGCGGGGAGSAVNTQDQNFGPFVTRAMQGHPQAVSQSQGTATITGVAGSAFTKITYNPAPNPANSRLLFVRKNPLGPSALYIANHDGTNPRAVPGVYPAFIASWSRDGRIAFDAWDASVSLYQIFVVNSDGTNLHRISSGTFNDLSPAWAPDNLHIALIHTDTSGFQQVYTMTASGGSLTHLTDGTANEAIPTWSSNSSQVYFTRFNGSIHALWRVNANGTSPTLIVSSDIQGIAASPLGTRLATSYAGGSQVNMYEYGLPNYDGIGIVHGAASTTYYVWGWSPDGNFLLYTKGTASADEVDYSNVDGFNEQQLEGFGDTTINMGAWEPYPLAIPYVASTGGYTVNNASSGFLYGLNGTALASFLNFTATTPASATLTIDPITSGSSAMIVHIRADAITSIKYLNGFGGGVVNVAESGTTPHALVAFSTADGSVASVLTLAAKSAVTKQGNVLQAKFSGVWNSKGVNLAPHGASQVVLNKSGEVTSLY